MSLLLMVSIILSLFLAAFGLLIARLFARVEDSENPAEWLENFSIDVYRPMERLFNERDYGYLANQPGYQPSIARELRAERKRIFRAYLRQLIKDFHRLVDIANLMMVHADDDRVDLARNIFRLRITFYSAVLRTELSLVGLPVPALTGKARQLIGTLALMRESIHSMVPAA